MFYVGFAGGVQPYLRKPGFRRRKSLSATQVKGDTPYKRGGCGC